MADSTLGRVSEGMKATAAAAQDRARDQFASTSEVIRHSATDAVQQARSMVRDAAEQQKHRAAEGIQGFARSLHDMARNLDSEHQDIPARYTHLAAEQLERTAQALDRRSMEEMLTDVERFARRRPAVFIGSAFAAGFLVARFLKSSQSAEAGSTGTAYGTAYGAVPRSRFDTAGQTGYAEYEPVRGGATEYGVTPSTSSTVKAATTSPPPTTGPSTPFTGTPTEVAGAQRSGKET